MKRFVAFLPVCLLLFLTPVASDAAAPSFRGLFKYITKYDPVSFCAADFNADGVQDLALATNYNGIALVLSNGDGTFQPEVDFGSGDKTVSICAGDFDEDGDQDLAAMHIGYDELPYYDGNDYFVVFRNAGNGSFSQVPGATMLGLNDAPSSACAPDLDGDGDADLVITLRNVNSVRSFVSAGNGTFAAGSTRTVGSTPNSVWPADFNGDGKIDIVVANPGSNNVSILLGAGDGTLAVPVNVAVGSQPYSVCAEDFNEDGDVDLAVANLASNNVSILIGNGNGGFAGPANVALASPQAIFPADLDDDGHQDLAVACPPAFSLCTLLGNGNGTFDPAACVTTGSDTPIGVAATDLNSDGTIDLVTPNAYSRCISVFLNTGIATFPTPPKYAAGDGPWAIITDDLDGDGDLDVAETNRYHDNVSVYFNLGQGSYASRVSYDAGDEPLSLCSGDFDDDGDRDLAVGNYSISNPGTVSVFLNQGNGTFGPRTPYTVLISPAAVCAADVNGDNIDDVIVANLRSDKISVLLSYGNGSLGLVAHYPAGTSPISVVAADLDGDGDQDLAVTNDSPVVSGSVSILKNIGGGVFSAPVAYGSVSQPYDICTADFDGDGDVDLGFVALGGGAYTLFNNGNGTFSGPTLYTAFSTFTSTTSICSADLDGDGDKDLAVSCSQRDEIWMLVNNGSGQFAGLKYGLYIGGPNFGPQAVASGDIDGDGDVDLLTANFNTDDVSVLINQKFAGVTPVNPPTVASRGALYQNVPNPFNPTTMIRYVVPRRERVTLTVYNVTGQRVRTLVDEVQMPRAGGFSVPWNGMNETGQPVASGVYFYRLTAGTYSQVRKMVLLK